MEEAKKRRVNQAALVHALMGVAVMVVSVSTRAGRSGSADAINLAGWGVMLLGVVLFAWALVHLGKAFLGEVEPVSNRLVSSGPYQRIRHPLYMSMIIFTLGLAIGLKSVEGVAAVVLFFVPACAYRARLEEKALAERFSQEWNKYAGQTCFMFPHLW